MPLISCSACGKEVSDQAPSCPNCGHPIASRLVNYATAPPPARAFVPPPPPVRSGNGWKIALGVVGGALAVLVVIVVIVMAALAPGSAGGSGGSSGQQAVAAPPAPAARFEITDTLSDEECSQLGDYCLRVHCTFHNKGDAAGEKAVSAELIDNASPVTDKTSRLTLLPGASQRVTFNFPEAELGEEHHYKYKCSTAN